MEGVYLMVQFLIEGNWYIVDGWYPLLQPDLNTCNQKIPILVDYLKTTLGFPEAEFIVTCEEI